MINSDGLKKKKKMREKLESAREMARRRQVGKSVVTLLNDYPLAIR